VATCSAPHVERLRGLSVVFAVHKTLESLNVVAHHLLSPDETSRLQHPADAVLLDHPHHVAGVPLEGVVVADDEGPRGPLDVQDLLGQVVAPVVVRVGRRLVEEGDVGDRDLVQERQRGLSRYR
jgi:hypothetical protein